MPGSLLPLHVFEPRYRQLVADCLRDELPLAVPLLVGDDVRDAAGRPKMYPYTGVGVLGAHQELADGRYNILVQPLARGRIVAERLTDHPYRVAEVELLDDVVVPKTLLTSTGERVRGLFGPLLGRLGPTSEGVGRALRALPAERVPEAIASVVLRTDDARQAFLAEDDPLRRAFLVETAVLTLLGEVSLHEAAEA
jgi:hypothetical protein